MRWLDGLVWHQGSQVSMRVARGNTSLLSSHGRGIGIQDALKEDFRGLSPVASGNPVFPRLVPVTSGILELRRHCGFSHEV